MVEEEYEEDAEEEFQDMDPIEKIMLSLKKENRRIVVYHPAPAARWNAPWKFMSDFEIPLVLICDDLDDQGTPRRLDRIDDDDWKYHPDMYHIPHVQEDGTIIRNEYCDAYSDLDLPYDNRLIYRGGTDAIEGIKELPSIDAIYLDYLIGYGISHEGGLWDFRKEAIKEIIAYANHIRDGGILFLEKSIVSEILNSNHDFKFRADGTLSRTRFGEIEIEYLGDYDLNIGEGERDNIDIFKIHSKLKLKNPLNFLDKCFIDIHWD